MCCTVVGDSVYYFLTFWGSNEIYYFVCQGGAIECGNAGAISLMGKVSDFGGIPENTTEIWSIDATTVYLESGEGQDQSNKKLERIALSMAFTGNLGGGYVGTALLKPEDAGATNKLPGQPLPPPSLGEATWLKLPSPGADSNFPYLQGPDGLPCTTGGAWRIP